MPLYACHKCVKDGSEDTPCVLFYEAPFDSSNKPDTCPYSGGEAVWKKVE